MPGTGWLENQKLSDHAYTLLALCLDEEDIALLSG
jgi:hypothetical protein